ncbi:MAG: cyclodeaminase/cyclohydrolase family protein [Thermoplasmata archaeon]
MGVDIEAPLRTFLEDVASQKPTPGGGSVAALAGALAAGLTSMVCRLTIGKERYKEVWGEMEHLLEESEKVRSSLQHLITEDALAYDAVSQALKMDRSTSEAKEKRREAFQQALRGAAEVPMETGRRCLDLLSTVREVAGKGNTNALSDAGVAAHLALAAFHGALLNVDINLSSIKAADYVAETRERMEAMAREAVEIHSLVLEVLRTRL